MKYVEVTVIEEYLGLKPGKRRVPEHMVPGYRALGILAPEDDYDELTVDELKDELRDRDLPVSGVKDELIRRLRAAGD